MRTVPGSSGFSDLPSGGLRRRALLMALTSGAVAGLGACGFKLRQAEHFAFSSIAVPGKLPFEQKLRRALKIQGTIEVLGPEEINAGKKAQAHFNYLGDERSSNVVSTNAAGMATEMTLYLGISYRVTFPDGREIVPTVKMTQSRDIAYNTTAALAKASESELLYNDMITELVQQTVRRLAAIRSLPVPQTP